MAIFRAECKPVSRASGRSAVAAAAYRSGERLTNARDGLTHDYRARSGVEASFIVTPDREGADRSALWNAAEAAEKRSDARVAREWIVALPAELDDEARAALARGFAEGLADRYGVMVDVAIHSPGKEGDERNHHAHLLCTTRQVARLEGGGLAMGEKASVELSDSKRRGLGLGAGADEITAIRAEWAGRCNAALERAGEAERVSHKSRHAQGLEGPPVVTLGPVASALERRGVQTDKGDVNRQIAADRAELAAARIERQGERGEARERREAVKTATGPERAALVDKVQEDRANQLERAREAADRRVDRREGLAAVAQDTKARSVGERLAAEARGLRDRITTEAGRVREWAAEKFGQVRERADDIRRAAGEAFKARFAPAARDSAEDARQQAGAAFKARLAATPEQKAERAAQEAEQARRHGQDHGQER